MPQKVNKSKTFPVDDKNDLMGIFTETLSNKNLTLLNHRKSDLQEDIYTHTHIYI